MPESISAKEKAQGDVVISVSDVSKTYRLYSSHQDRLKEALHPFRKRYHKEFPALSGVTFEIRRGESVGILGRNGAGKSTLLQIIAGVLSPTSGTIRVDGKVAALLELGAGFNPDITGRENVILANTIQGIPENEIAGRVAEVEAFADVGLFFDQPMKVYSSGMFARVAFANAINVNPDILIVDEILGVGDAKFQEKCYNKIKSLRDEGVCILFVSHSTEVIQRNCQKALLFEKGRISAQGTTDAVIAAYHDLLYGTKKASDILLAQNLLESNVPSSKAQTGARNADLAAFQEPNGEPLYLSKHYYNPHERRIGSREAEIADFLVLADGKSQFDILTGNETLSIYIKVKFHRNVERPQIGWALVTTEGVVIAGSSTVMQKCILSSARNGEVAIYDQELKLAICGGQYFLNIGIGEYQDQEWTYFDVRRSIIHLAVADSGRASGFFQIPSSCKDAHDLLG